MLASSLPIPALLHTPSFLSHSTCITPYKHLKAYLLSFFQYFSCPICAIHTINIITPSYRYSHIPNPLYLSTLFSTPYDLNLSSILDNTSLSHPPFSATHISKYLKQSTSTFSAYSKYFTYHFTIP